MRAGALRNKVTFQVATETPDGGGGASLSWTNVVTMRAEFRPELGRERLEAGRLEGSEAGILRVRYDSVSSTITTAHRALIDDVPYNIRSIVDPSRRKELLEMLVERGVAT